MSNAFFKNMMAVSMMLKPLFVIYAVLMKTTLYAGENDVVDKIFDINLPIVVIETVNGEMPTYEISNHPWGWGGQSIKNQTKVPGRLQIILRDNVLYDSGEYEEDQSGMTIRVRGNTSAYKHDKKPFKIKLQKKTDLLRRGDDQKYKDKNWLLLKDENLRKNFCFKVNELIGIQWTPAYEYVNVIINGQYHGIYMLVESVNRNTSCRLNVDKTGFIFEYDIYWWNEDVYVPSPTSLPGDMHYTFKYPDPDQLSEERLDYFRNMIRQAELSLSDGTYPDYIDVNSFASWILGHDIIGNLDGKGSNYFLTKIDDSDTTKIMMANMWDTEHMFEMPDDWDAAHNYFFFPGLFSNENDTFRRAYKDKWNEVSPTLFNQFKTYLEDFSNSDVAKAIDESMPLNNERWNKDYGTVRQYIDEAESWLAERKGWLESHISQIQTGIHEIPSSDQQEKNYFYYTLHGQRLNSPQDYHGVYIHHGKKILHK